MINANTVLVNLGINEFKKVSSAIRTNYSPFIRKFLNQGIMRSMLKSMNDVLFINVMLQRCFMKFDENIHELNIA